MVGEECCVCSLLYFPRDFADILSQCATETPHPRIPKFFAQEQSRSKGAISSLAKPPE